MKIAPDLSHALDYMGNQYQSEYAKSLVADARAELRALLAVARAASAYAAALPGTAAESKAIIALRTAVARLEKVSKGGKP